MFAHDDGCRIRKKGEVGYEADNAFAGYVHNPTFSHSEEPHVEVIQMIPNHAPIVAKPRLVRGEQTPFFGGADPCKSVVRWVSKNHENRRISFHRLRCIPFLLKLWKDDLLLVGMLVPPRKGVSQVDSSSLAFALVQRRTESSEKQAQLQVGNYEWGGQQFEAKDSLLSRYLHILADKRVSLALLQSSGDGTQHFNKVGTRARTWIENDHSWVGQTIREFKV